MFSWKGKLIGGIIGFIIGNFIGLALGVLIGHLFDKGVFSNLFSGGRGNFQQSQQVQKVFFDSSFSIMGYLAKADGRVSEKEIAIARRVMNEMNLNAEMQREAIRLFNLGKQPQFDLGGTLERLKRVCYRHPNVLRTFLEIQLQIAYADGSISVEKRQALQVICSQLGLFGFNFDQFERQYRAGQNYQRHRQTSYNPRRYLKDAYSVLEVSPQASDVEVKKAYRRLMSKHHPDKLASQGVPPEMIKLATQKTQRVKSAYEEIREKRGF